MSAKVASRGTATWEWDNNGSWTLFDNKTTKMLETAFQQNPTQILTLTHGIFGKQGGYDVDFQAMNQTRKKTKFSRKIRRNGSTSSTPTSISTSTPTSISTTNNSTSTNNTTNNNTNSTPQWEWKDTAWTAYDQQTTTLIEQGYANPSVTSIKLTHGFFGTQGGYSIDFITMKQTKDSSGYQRNIRRNPPAAAKQALPQVEPHWFYLKQEDDWIEFDKITSKLLETACKRGLNTLVLSHGDYSKQKGGPWKVDFNNVVVFNVENPTNHTKIKRDPPYTGANYNKPTAELNILKFSEEERDDVPNSLASLSLNEYGPIAKLTNWKELHAQECSELQEEQCVICLREISQFTAQNPPVKLSKCLGTHFFHRDCIGHCATQGFIVCPVCNVIYGTRVGSMPLGTMSTNVRKHAETPLSGYSCDTIVIKYVFPGGTQGPEHPNPGASYGGTTRTCYLPDNKEGQKILRLLKIAWERRLTFRIGQSVTSGQDNQVVWNNIHHKTQTSEGAFGYPDPTYLTRVRAELADKGVFESEDDEKDYRQEMQKLAEVKRLEEKKKSEEEKKKKQANQN